MNKLIIVFVLMASWSDLKAEGAILIGKRPGEYWVYPNKPPKFDQMIMRFDSVTRQGRWECEFGIVTATKTVDSNLILESVGCEEKAQGTNRTISSPYMFMPGAYPTTTPL